MEINQMDQSKEIVWINGDGPDGQGSKSYTCTFCKRGFSNAQALGGHMNIHRKDRARLKESSDDHETPISSDIIKKTLVSCSGEDNLNLVQQEESCREEEKTSALKRLWLFPDDDDYCASPRKKDAMGEVLQLPLFVQTPSTTNSIDGPKNIGENHDPANCQTSLSSTTTELDLELRLGMNSHEKLRNKLN